MMKRGRPVKPPSTPRVQLSCVISARTKSRLMEAATRNQRPIASEVAARLEASFDEPAQIKRWQSALRAVLKEDEGVWKPASADVAGEKTRGPAISASDPSPPPTKHLRQADVARRWQMSPRTLERWRWQKIGPRFVAIGENTIIYRLEDIEAYEAGRVS